MCPSYGGRSSRPRSGRSDLRTLTPYSSRAVVVWFPGVARAVACPAPACVRFRSVAAFQGTSGDVVATANGVITAPDALSAAGEKKTRIRRVTTRRIPTKGVLDRGRSSRRPKKRPSRRRSRGRRPRTLLFWPHSGQRCGYVQRLFIFSFFYVRV
jgi:hypothetical protein